MGDHSPRLSRVPLPRRRRGASSLLALFCDEDRLRAAISPSNTRRALYQLQLVKSSEAKKFIPDDMKLVEAFG